jgi:hypothetical protein
MFCSIGPCPFSQGRMRSASLEEQPDGFEERSAFAELEERRPSDASTAEGKAVASSEAPTLRSSTATEDGKPSAPEGA